MRAVRPVQHMLKIPTREPHHTISLFRSTAAVPRWLRAAFTRQTRMLPSTVTHEHSLHAVFHAP
jgi:hypothetical protein